MTLSALPNWSSFIGSGSVGPFSFAMVFLTNAEISVVTTDLTGHSTTLTLNTDYAIAGAGNNAGGSITLTNALAAGWTLTITRTVPILQGTSLPNQGAFFAPTIEGALDYLTMICQQLNALVQGVIQNPQSASYVPFFYSLVMTADGVIPYSATIMVCSIDPGGVIRDLNPASGFPAGSVLFIQNIGTPALTFNSADLPQAIGPGQKTFFIYDGEHWR